MPGLDPESREILKALFDSSRENLGFWNFLHFFRFKIGSHGEEENLDLTVMNALVYPLDENGEIDDYGMDKLYYSEYYIDDAMYVPHAYVNSDYGSHYENLYGKISLASLIKTYSRGRFFGRDTVRVKYFMQAMSHIEWRLFKFKP